MKPDLHVLVEKKYDLHLAEVAAWLHDMGKCSDEMIKKTAWDKPKDFKYNHKTEYSYLVEGYDVVFLSEKIALKRLVEESKATASDRKNNEKWLIATLGRCHGAAHIEKEEPLTKDGKQGLEKEIKRYENDIVRKQRGANTKRDTADYLEKSGKGDPNKLRGDADSLEREALDLHKHRVELLSKLKLVHQSKDDTRLCSPFGFDYKKAEQLTPRLKNLSYHEIPNRVFINEAKHLFKDALGDTRRPINEIVLDDWSGIVAALYKSALAGALLGNKPEPNDLRWRLLSIRFNSEQVWGSASTIPVLRARKSWLDKGLNNVKQLLEEKYNLGNEIYRDEDGSIFVVPNFQDILEISDSMNSTALKDMISERLGYEGEVAVAPKLSDHWCGQNPKRQPGPDDEIPPIADILKEISDSPADPTMVKGWWDEVKGREICTVSWLRPQSRERDPQKASDYWAGKIGGRAKEWCEDLRTTIWTDEVADDNGRICLIVGKIDISKWLYSDGHINTLLVKPSDGKNEAVTKTPSFARIRRIWKTTETFWKEIEQAFWVENIAGLPRPRLKLTGTFETKNSRIDILKFNTYEAELGGKMFSLFYVGNNEFIIVDYLQRLAGKICDASEVSDLAKCVESSLLGKKLKLYSSEKHRWNMIDEFRVSNIEHMPETYVPAIPILSEPSIFMAIVPASKALDVANHIKKKYETEMGKVRNRLPIMLGFVFGRPHTPLSALMDAGRRMLKASLKTEYWTLGADAQICGTDCLLNFENGATWRVPVMMGDSETEDVWYPYFYVNGNSIDRSLAFKNKINKKWLVHAKELKKLENVNIEPSKFDFEFMDSVSRRFEVIYDKGGKRRDPLRSQRPYLLEELDDFEISWKLLSEGLARNQIKNLVCLIETKREEWIPEVGDEFFNKFVHDVLHNANWKNGTPSEIGKLEQEATSGKLRDVVELYMDILKSRPEVDREGESE